MFFQQKKRSEEELLNDHLRQEYEATDFGRRYGWWLCLCGKRIADVNYICWDSNSQFWHAYRVFPFDPTFAEEIGFDADRWCKPDVSLESRYAEGFREIGVLMAPRTNNIIVIRSAHVPEREFMRVARRTDEI
jgi:hypothetical protein